MLMLLSKYDFARDKLGLEESFSLVILSFDLSFPCVFKSDFIRLKFESFLAILRFTLGCSAFELLEEDSILMVVCTLGVLFTPKHHLQPNNLFFFCGLILDFSLSENIALLKSSLISLFSWCFTERNAIFSIGLTKADVTLSFLSFFFSPETSILTLKFFCTLTPPPPLPPQPILCYSSCSLLY
ncbi:unnamed protein product [Moneuplotes crassus]|uniref:Uncharacterized protein n=1 Tax=Euplotes crassus TaxID=5936 RepID=A0AAD1XPE5_EUPCR|nr:unnamed protein product [Moneuplotes crassus]